MKIKLCFIVAGNIKSS